MALRADPEAERDRDARGLERRALSPARARRYQVITFTARHVAPEWPVSRDQTPEVPPSDEGRVAWGAIYPIK